MDKFKGIFPALLTPFREDYSINENALRQLIQYNLEKGVKGFYVGGSASEAFLMSDEERRRVMAVAAEQMADSCTMIAHVGNISTATTIELAKYAEGLGAHAISAVPPFYYKFNMEEIIEHYLSLSESVSIPLIIYVMPFLTGVNFGMDNYKRLLDQPKIIGLKFTDSNLYQLERLIKVNPNKVILFGWDEMALGAFAMGADGGIGSTYNLQADKFIELKALVDRNQMQEARLTQEEINTVIDALMKVGVFAGLKYALTLKGIECGVSRKPFRRLSAEQREKVKEVVARYL